MRLPYLLLFLKGMAMGAADIVPGVSGGTIAFITNIYNPLLSALHAFNLKALRLLKERKVKQLWTHIHGSFLFAVGGGIAVSLLTFARAVTYLLHRHPIPVWAFFGGLTGSSIILIFHKMNHYTFKALGLVAVFAVGSFLLLNNAHYELPHTYWMTYLSGMIAICAMILPGISGGYILLLLGQYSFVIEALRNFHFPLLMTFGLGCATGIVLFVRLIRFLLQQYHDLTLASLIGIMLGAWPKLWPWKYRIPQNALETGEAIPWVAKNISPAQFKAMGYNPHVSFAIVFFLIGFTLVLGLEMWASKKGGTHDQKEIE